MWQSHCGKDKQTADENAKREWFAEDKDAEGNTEDYFQQTNKRSDADIHIF